MGFLDELKRQAEALQAQQSTDTAALERNTALADAACKGVFTYLDTLARQLIVLKPQSRVRYALDKKTVFDGLPLTGLKVDARRRMLRGSEVFDHVALHGKLASGKKLVLAKNFPPEVEKLESRLRQSGALVHAQPVRDPDNGKLLEMRYEVHADFVLGVRVTPDHDRGRLAFHLVNLDGFETVDVAFPATEVGSARLDELARWLLGEPHRFLDGGQDLRRTEALGL